MAPEDFGDWKKDIRGGVILIACCQVARALQGKTLLISADTVMSDDGHNTEEYLAFIRSATNNPTRYESREPIRLIKECADWKGHYISTKAYRSFRCTSLDIMTK